ncbi:polymorphic toxin-type HINT domain-containing protein [Streptomyces sp. HSW2009]|uniref:polymorphic toxin-type HINT domain-containing protein n=1 Tax=Streptomyces sp. HSW2009 TaxID=3142890 RepID=UPI0032EE5111
MTDRDRLRPGLGRGLRGTLTLAVTAVMVGSLLQATSTPDAAADSAPGRPDLPAAERPVAGSTATGKARTPSEGPAVPADPPRADWPAAATATVRLPAPASQRTATTNDLVKAAGTPVSVAPAATAQARTTTGAARSATVRVLDRDQARRAGVPGVLLSVTPNALPQRAERWSVAVDYAAFAEAFGGGYRSRLRLVEVPDCVLRTPQDARCQTTRPLAFDNDTERQRLSSDAVELRRDRPTVLAVLAGDEGKTGDYTASPLSPSSSWETHLNTGDFSWSYQMPVPSVPGELKPKLSLGYSSGAVDGRTSSTNNQGSWAGDGFDLWPGYIERRYKPCYDDGVKNADGSEPGDLCWSYDNAFVSLDGKSGELVPAGTNEWKLQKDDGTRITKLTSSDRANGDNDDEYWRLVAPDGTQYFFGYHRLPGWAAGKETTDSTWSVPVFGNNANEPCHKDGFAASWCQQAWRWNLDYVVDPHGNAMSLYYGRETNSYGRNLKADDDTPYTRGGHLKRIEYGLKSGDLYKDKALARVDFADAERCLPQTGVTCDASTIDDKAFYWYDTPWDLNCKAATKCDKGRLSPTFWTRKRLTEVTAKVLQGDAYKPVDSWKLGYRWGMADVDRQLLLDSVQHTGHSAAAPITLPKTTLAYTQLANRLDKTGDGFAPYIKDRLSTVADEYGAQTDVNYSAAVCDGDKLPTPHTNTTRCFPQYLGGSNSDDPDRHWFNKYVVDSVTATDRTGGAPDQVTRYTYLGGGAWHYDDDDGLTKEKFKTWSQWRGYGQVRVQTGGQGTGGMKTQRDAYFLRGMDGDRKEPSGGTKEVTVALDAGEGDPLTDHASAAGFGYKNVTYSGPDGKVLEKGVERPWHHQTATRTRPWGTVTADFTGTASSAAWTSLDAGAGAKWRKSATSYQHDTVAGRVTQVDDEGDTGTASDDQCTRTTYVDNANANLRTLPSRVEAVAVACDRTPDRSKDVISDVRTAYDGGGYGASPTKGDATATAKLKEYAGTKATYLEAGQTFDGYGRPLTATDLTATVTADGSGTPTRSPRTDGRTTTTAYTPATGFPTQSKVTLPPAKPGDTSTAQTTTTELDPLRGQPTVRTDPNGKASKFTYDALGRSSKVWLADRTLASDLLPTYEFSYTTTDGQPVAVGTKSLENEGRQRTSYLLFDGFLRERQTQEPGPDGGRVLTDVFYDDRGLKAKTFAAYYTQGKPATGLFKPADALGVETQTWYGHDGLGREVEAREVAGNGDGGKVLATTRTVYGGDRTTVLPPVGDTATTTLTDARDRTTELRQHHSRAADAPYDTTRYTHTPAGELATVVDPAGNTWRYAYDQLGRQIRTEDPDKGALTSVYDDRDQLVSTTDARGKTLTRVYDGIGRQTELREGGATGALRAKWVFDTIAGAKGHPTEATRYVDGNAYTTRVGAYDRLYRALKTDTVIPAAEGALAGTYQTKTTYEASGLVAGVGYSPAGSLPGGGVTYGYEDATLRQLYVAGQGIRADAKYSLTGKPLQYQFGLDDGAKKTWATNAYEWGTQRLASTRVDREDVNGVDRNSAYSYDEAGNVRALSDVSRSGTDTQCFTYDHLRRLTQAWTQATAACAAQPTGETVAGPAPYWRSYTYDKIGNRLSETEHDLTGTSARNTTHTYSYPEPGKPRPHGLTAVDTSGPAGTAKNTYRYDAAGYTEARTLGGDTQDLTWDAEGRLGKLTAPVGDDATSSTSYVYDADGGRLIGRTDTETTLYLGHTEVTLAKGATKPTAVRYADLGGGHQAVIADDRSVSYTLADHHGTGELAIKAADLAMTQRRSLPFGAPRGPQPTGWPGTKGFVGGTQDASTGLTHLGAREYDPTTGRFLSVDPVMDLTDPQQFHGYAYANNSPLTYSDPTGLRPDGPVGGADHNDQAYYRENGQLGSGWYLDYYGGWSYRQIKPSPRPQGAKRDVTYISYQWSKQAQARGVSANFGSREIKEKAKSPNLWRPIVNIVVDTFVPDPTPVKECITEGDGSSCLQVPLEAPTPAKAFKFFKGLYKATRRQCHSFLPDTKVLLADGRTKEIADVTTGDRVTVTDPETGETSTRDVVGTIVTEDDKEFVDLAITTDGRSSSLVSTTTHPFWVLDAAPSGQWVDAGDLKPGMRLRTPDGDRAEVSAVRTFQRQQRTHDLTVAGVHTYYVVAGVAPVLVHNSGNCDLPLKSLHPDSSLDRSSLDFWGKQDTEDIIFSLRPGAREALRVKPDGTIANGNTRVKVLRDRGYDVDSLPREPYGSNRPMTDEDFWDIDQ